MPALGATGELSARTVSLARRRNLPSSAMVAPDGMNPAMLSLRKNVRVRMKTRDAKPPSATSEGLGAQRPKDGHGQAHHADGGQHRQVPGPAPQHAVEGQGGAGHRQGDGAGHDPRLRADPA